MTNKIHLGLAALCLTACTASPNSAPAINAQAFSAQARALAAQFKAQGQNTQILRVSPTPSQAALAVRIQPVQQDFAVQASSNGAVAKVLADVSDYELFLFECSAAPTPGAAGSETDLDTGNCAQIFNATVSATGSATQNFVFDHVAQNTVGSRYFVGISAMEAGPVNITAFTGFLSSGAQPAPGAIALSNGGGDGDGGVAVNASFAVSNTAALQLPLSLLDAVGAGLDSQVTVSNGSSTLPTISVN